MHPSSFNFLDNKNLSPRFIIVKRIGQFGMIVALAGISVFQFNGGNIAETPLLGIVPGLVAGGLVVSMICFAILALASSGKTKTNSTARAMGRSFLKVSLYIYLPAFIIAAILIVIFVLPRYQ